MCRDGFWCDLQANIIVLSQETLQSLRGYLQKEAPGDRYTRNCEESFGETLRMQGFHCIPRILESTLN
jgi:hypothetical protein